MAGIEEVLSSGAPFRGYLVIFVTVGTHEQPFDRLILAVEEAVQAGRIREPVCYQLGHCRMTPKHGSGEPFYPFQKMMALFEEARVVVTHGGDSIMLILSLGKIPVVFPRDPAHGEHVDDHQMRFARVMAKRGLVLSCFDNQDLAQILEEYDERMDVLQRPAPGSRQFHASREFISRFDGEVSKLLGK